MEPAIKKAKEDRYGVEIPRGKISHYKPNRRMVESRSIFIRASEIDI